MILLSGVFVLHITKVVSDVASSEVEPSDVASSEVEPSDVASSEAEPSDVASSEVEPSDVASSEVEPSDVASSEVEPVSFAIGETLSSYDDLQKKLAKFEKSHSVQLTQRDSRTLEAAARRVPKRVKNANAALVYYSINFSCVFGGKKYNSKGSGKRPHQRYTELVNSRLL